MEDNDNISKNKESCKSDSSAPDQSSEKNNAQDAGLKESSKSENVQQVKDSQEVSSAEEVESKGADVKENKEENAPTQETEQASQPQEDKKEETEQSADTAEGTESESVEVKESKEEDVPQQEADQVSKAKDDKVSASQPSVDSKPDDSNHKKLTDIKTIPKDVTKSSRNYFKLFLKFIWKCITFWGVLFEPSESDKKTDKIVQKPEVEEEPLEQSDKDIPEVKKKIFFVPGTNKSMQKDVENILTKSDIEPVIDRMRHNYSVSLEKKFEKYSDVNFAIVLLSADDFVYPKNGKPANAKLRASQNSVFELGYHLAKLGRQNVFILYYEQRSFLLPTDFLNAVYIPYDKWGHWKTELKKRLEAFGYEVSIEKKV